MKYSPSSFATPPATPPAQVVIGDKVILTQVNTGQMLHVSELSLGDHPECREVNADPTGSSWKICIFMEHKEDKQDILKGVQSCDLRGTVVI